MDNAVEIGGTISAAALAVCWVLVRRLRTAKRIMPRAHFQVRFSVRTPKTSDAPEEELIEAELIESDPPLEPEPPRKATTRPKERRR